RDQPRARPDADEGGDVEARPGGWPTLPRLNPRRPSGPISDRARCRPALGDATRALRHPRLHDRTGRGVHPLRNTVPPQSPPQAADACTRRTGESPGAGRSPAHTAGEHLPGGNPDPLRRMRSGAVARASGIATDWHLIPLLTIEKPASGLWRRPAPLLEEERHALVDAAITKFVQPLDPHRAMPRAGVAAGNQPSDPVQPEPLERTQ